MRQQIVTETIVCDICKKEMVDWSESNTTPVKVLSITTSAYYGRATKASDICKSCSGRISALLYELSEGK